MTEPNLQNRLREARTAAGLSQQELARRAGLTRQAICAIEGEQYVPNTAAALRLAQVLGCRVEDLFRIPDATPQCSVRLWGKPEPGVRRLAVARVRGELIGHPLAHERALAEGFTSADGILADSPGARSRGSTAAVQLLSSPERLENVALLLGCDPSLGILGTQLERHSGSHRLLWLSMQSRSALDAVASGAAHVAGSHILDAKTGVFNLAQATDALADTGGVLVGFASWEQGLMVTRGNPLGLKGVADLTRKGVRFVNREKGAGSREVFDRLLAETGVPKGSVQGYDRIAASHLAVARTIAAGGADAGIGLAAVASACGLGFVPLRPVEFDFTIPSDLLEHPAVAALLDLLQSRSLRAELSSLPGYDLGRLGKVLARIPPAAARAG